MGASDLLQSLHGVSAAKPGASKLECPNCQKRALGVARSDAFGHCFACGWSLSSAQAFPGVSSVLRRIVDDCRVELKRDGGAGALAYCRGRGVSQGVIEALNLGAIPHSYDPRPHWDRAREETRKLLERKDQAARKKRDLRANLERLDEAEKLLLSHLYPQGGFARAGWLVLPWADQRGEVRSLKIRDPDRTRKQMRQYAPTARRGLFGTQSLIRDAKHLLLVEGEFDALRIQSIAWEASGSLLPVLATGGATATDLETIRMIPEGLRVLWLDPDQEGRQLLEAIASVSDVRSFSTPPHDPDAWIGERLKAGAKPSEVAEELVRLVGESAPHSRPIAAVADEIRGIRRRQGPTFKAFEVSEAVADLVDRDLSRRGRFFRRGSDVWYINGTREVMEAEPYTQADVTPWKSYVSQYGLNPADQITKQVVAHVLVERQKIDESLVLPSWHYDEAANVVRWNAGDGRIVVIGEHGTHEERNGDFALFTGAVEPFSLELEGADPDLWIEALVRSNVWDDQEGLSSGAQDFLFAWWIRSLPFLAWTQDRPILLATGNQGSGKTTALRRIGWLLFGPDWEVSTVSGDDRKDFDLLVRSRQFAVLDQVEMRHDWLEDVLCTIATGGVIERRRLYTNSTSDSYRPEIGLALTSIAARFRRDDVASRTIPLRFADRDLRRSPQEIRGEILGRRDELLSSLAADLSRTLAAWGRARAAGWRYSGSVRMAGWASLVCGAAAELGTSRQAAEAFEELQDAQRTWGVEMDPTFELLDLVVSDLPPSETRISATELYRMIAEKAAASKVNWATTSPRGLAAKLRRHQRQVEELGVRRVWRGRDKCWEYVINARDERVPF